MSGAAFESIVRAQSPREGRALADRLKLLALATVVVMLAKAFVVDVVVVEGNSMLPTMRSGDWVLVEKLTPRLGLLRPGHVVLMTARSSHILIVKRIVALGGQYVEAKYGRVIVDGEPEPAEAETIPGGGGWAPTFVPEGDVFVLGDNRAQSEDSSDFGPVPASQVKGRVMPAISRWTTALTTRLGGFLPSAGSGKTPRAGRTARIRPGLAATALGAMSQVETAHITGGGKEIWISQDRGVRIDTERGFTLLTDEAMWEYDGDKNEVTILDGVPSAAVSWGYLEQVAGIGQLQTLTYAGTGYEYTVVDDVLDDKAMRRIETSGGARGCGATIWIDEESTRVVKIKQWRVQAGVRHETHPTVWVDYDAPRDPEVFVPSFPPDALIVDRCTNARRGHVHAVAPLV